MSPAVARPLLHAVHLAAALVLLATGMLLLIPGLRAHVTGGHSLVIRDTHRWGGVAFAVLPALIAAGAGTRAVLAVPGRGARALWRRLHLATTVATGAAFTVTGAALWGARHVPDGLADGARALHTWLTWALLALVAAHLAALAASRAAAWPGWPAQR
jgi:hypothetical protein